MKKGLDLSCQAPVVGLPPFPAPMKKPPFVVKERFFSRLAVHYFVFLYVSLCTLLQKNNKTKNTVETVSKLFAPIHITIQIPEEYRNVSGREFSIIRLHGDTVTVLEDLDDDPNTITISTDEFSLYALAYTDGAGAAGTVVSPGTVQGSGNASASGTSVVVRAATPQTGDTANIAVYLALSFTAAVTIAGIFIKRRQAS